MPEVGGKYRMNPQQARRVAADRDAEAPKSEKLDRAVVLYFPPKEIGDHEGACCAQCMMFQPFGENGMGFCTVVEGDISGPDGVCGLYVHGKHSGPNMKGMMAKEIAGYVDGTKSDGSGGKAGEAPTHCGNCMYFEADEEECEKVKGHIEAEGCCNLWAPE